ncbi:uncharacterized protein I303_107553 [Kwoniella dejecticola CBS 10117]|uniref:Major facilitator superfamily (MFS) profile domain-containing protein n=1 Tax=Kwoniella dejecticola CBS 10117 TaxID=1296121 RepID=A0AAJ8MKE2_9TREE
MTKAHFLDIPNNTAAAWWKDPGLRKNVFHCLGCCFCVFYLGYDQSLLTGLQAVPQWNAFFGSPSGNKLGLIAASIFLPSIVTAFIGDYIAYRHGRRWAIWIGSILIFIGALVNALATNLGMFIGGRVILGSGGALTKVGAPSLLQEIAHPRLRPSMAGLYYGFYYTGSLTSACLCIAGLYIPGNWGWRFPAIVQILGPSIVLAITVTAPESPRFLIKMGKNEQAMRVLTKYHANGATNDPLVQWEYEEIVAALHEEELRPKSSYMDFFRTRGNRLRLAAVISLSFGTNWVGNGLVSYYLSPVLKSVGVTQPVQITGINAGLAFWNLCVAVITGLNIDRFGRRPLAFTSIGGMFCSYAIVMALSAAFAQHHNQSAGLAAIPFLFLFYGFYTLFWTPVPYPYSAEILPYSLRSKGLAIFTSVQNIANAFNQFVNPIALKAIAWRYYAVYLAVLAVYFVIAFVLYRESKNLTLEEISVLYDYPLRGGREQARQALQRQVAHEASDKHGDAKGDFEHAERV